MVMIKCTHHIKTMLGKLGDNTMYCATYKTHAMTTHDGGTGHTGNERDLDCHAQDTGGTDIGPAKDNESTNSSDTMLTFGGSEADGCLGNLLPSSQANLTTLTTDIKSL